MKIQTESIKLGQYDLTQVGLACCCASIRKKYAKYEWITKNIDLAVCWALVIPLDYKLS